MTMLTDIFEERVAAAMTVPVGGGCYDLTEPLAYQSRSPSTSGSTRASSPGGDSSGTCGDASCRTNSLGSKRKENAYETTLAQRRGLRAAILSDLGIDADSTANCASSDSPPSMLPTPKEAPRSDNSTTIHITGTRPAPGPRALVHDASQRSPAAQRATTQVSPSTPQVNSRISPNCLGSSPGSGRDASQRSPVGSFAIQTCQSPSWNNAPRLMATPTITSAARMPTSSTPKGRATLFGTAGKKPVVAASAASCRERGVAHGTVAFRCEDAYITQIPSDEALTQILKHNGLEALTSEELAARLCAAAPTEYDD